MLSNSAGTKVSKFSGRLQGSQPLARQKTLAGMSIDGATFAVAPRQARGRRGPGSRPVKLGDVRHLY
jgi:hypothetical protein